jgi:hypothetical protein
MIESFSDEDKLLVRYLFNELDENKGRELEDEMLLDDELAERAEVVEMNLIDCYVRNVLTAAERLGGAERFLGVPENKVKVDRARMFQQSLNLSSEKNQFVTQPTDNQGWRGMFPGFFARPLPALALLTTVVILIAALIVFEIRRRTPNPNSLTTNSARPAPVNQNAPNSTTPAPPSKNAGPELARSDPQKYTQYEYIHRQDWNGAERGGPVVHLTIGPQVKTLNLVYELGNDKAAAKETYGITIKNQYGERVWPQNKLKEDIKPVFEKGGKRQKLIVVKMPVKVFTDAGSYSFEIDDQYLPAKQFTVKR